jgi:group I intron endonuclease
MKGIYKITNLINGKVYIGKSEVSIEERWKAESAGYTNDHFANAIKKYGVENFKFEVLIETQENLNELETQFIREFRSHDQQFGYNKTFGGDGVIQTEETRRKMSENWTPREPWNKGKKLGPLSKEHRSKIAAGNKIAVRPPQTEEQKRKNSEAHKGIFPSAETRAKRSASMKGKNTGPKSPEHRKKLSESHKGVSTWNKGLKASEELRKTLSEAHMGLKYALEERICPYCGKKGRGGAMGRWHFDNCRLNGRSIEN